MSPLSLRRYRAERLLRQEFEGLRVKVLSTVRRRLVARGVTIDLGDLEANYAQAWQGLYAAVLAGQEIANPTGWLVLVTFRRAIEDYRTSHPERRAGELEAEEHGRETDLASRMDDQRRLRQVFEALRERLSERECQAASLCYLQGLSRAEAAAQMGISEARMRKLMEGDGSRRQGVAGKMGQLLSIIRTEGWCEEQASLMRGFAFGILDPEGERYKLAVMHQRECPACRAYVASLRGLAAILPPLLLRGGLGAGLAGAGAGTGAGVGTGAISGAGMGSVSGVSGGWLFAGGSLSVKFASCLALIGVGAGCLALTTVHRQASTHRQIRLADVGQPYLAGRQSLLSPAPAFAPAATGTTAKARSGRQGATKPHRRAHQHAGTARRNPALGAEAEFSPEHPNTSPQPSPPISQTSVPQSTSTRTSSSPPPQTTSTTANTEFGFESQSK